MGKKPDALGDRMKSYEMAEAGRKAMPGLPLLVRLDGRAFHTFCHGMGKPFDPGMSHSMVSTARALVNEFKPSIGYTQSDEITLLFPNPSALFDGRFQKMTSVLAGFASSYFYRMARDNLLLRGPDTYPHFDARAWQVPSRDEARNVFLWREDDAVKNSISMAASALYSHKQLMHKNSADKHEMLHKAGINWNSYDAHFKRGVYVQRRSYLRTLTADELEHIPEKHRPKGPVMRSKVEVLDLPPIRRMPIAEAMPILFAEFVTTPGPD